jgi:hypothetical protein
LSIFVYVSIIDRDCQLIGAKGMTAAQNNSDERTHHHHQSSIIDLITHHVASIEHATIMKLL